MKRVFNVAALKGGVVRIRFALTHGFFQHVLTPDEARELSLELLIAAGEADRNNEYNSDT